MVGEARVGFEGGVDGVVGEVEEEGALIIDAIFDGFVGFEGEGFGEEGVGAVVLVETWDGVVGAFFVVFAVAIFCVVAAWGAGGEASDVDVEAEVLRVFAWVVAWGEVCFADVDGVELVCLEQAWKGDAVGVEAVPVPVFWALVAAVVLVGVDPVGGVVSCGVLAGEDGGAGGGADAHGVELAEADAAFGEALHAGGAVVVVEWVGLWFAVGVGEERDGGVHEAHVIDEEDDDVG